MNLEAIRRFDEIEYVEVHERSPADEESLAAVGDPGVHSDIGRVFFVPYGEIVEGGPEGVTVEIMASTHTVVVQLWKSAYRYLLTGLLIVVVFASAMFLIANRFLIYPVVKLSAYALALNVESVAKPRQLELSRGPLHRRRDELDILRDAFEGLQNRLRRQVLDRDKANELYRALFENTHAIMLAIDSDDVEII